MTDWVTISSLATAGGTLVLAIATFAAVRSSNRSAKIAELSFQEQRRPVLTHSRADDAPQRIAFGDGHWVEVKGSEAVLDETDEALYFALSLRNSGAGIGVLQGWHVQTYSDWTRVSREHPPLEEFRLQTRDLYVAGGDVGMWQGALRGAEDADRRREIHRAMSERTVIHIDLLYSDQRGGQRAITRFSVLPIDDDRWLAGAALHWPLDQPGPH